MCVVQKSFSFVSNICILFCLNILLNQKYCLLTRERGDNHKGEGNNKPNKNRHFPPPCGFLLALLFPYPPLFGGFCTCSPALCFLYRSCFEFRLIFLCSVPFGLLSRQAGVKCFFYIHGKCLPDILSPEYIKLL